MWMQAYDHKYGKHVALKMIKNKKRLHDQALIELRTLKKLDDADPKHDNNVVGATMRQRPLQPTVDLRVTSVISTPGKSDWISFHDGHPRRSTCATTFTSVSTCASSLISSTCQCTTTWRRPTSRACRWTASAGTPMQSLQRELSKPALVFE
jgi:hypothetical protein